MRRTSMPSLVSKKKFLRFPNYKMSNTLLIFQNVVERSKPFRPQI